MTTTKESIANCLLFIIEAIAEGNINSLYEIEEMDNGSLDEFAEDYNFNPNDLTTATSMMRQIYNKNWA